jgi:hypothetical protein
LSWSVAVPVTFTGKRIEAWRKKGGIEKQNHYREAAAIRHARRRFDSKKLPYR